MYGKMEKAKYLGIGLLVFCLIGLTASPAYSQEEDIGGGELAGAVQLMEAALIAVAVRNRIASWPREVARPHPASRLRRG